MQPRSTIGSSVALMQFLDQLHQLLIILPVRTDGARPPGIVAALRYPKQLTQACDFMEVAVLLDEFEFHFFFLSKNRCAFFRISSSS